MTTAEATRRICPVAGCTRELGANAKTGVPQLMCPSDWRRVPHSLKLRIIHLQRQVTAQRPTSQQWADFTRAFRAAVYKAEQRRRA